MQSPQWEVYTSLSAAPAGHPHFQWSEYETVDWEAAAAGAFGGEHDDVAAGAAPGVAPGAAPAASAVAADLSPAVNSYCVRKGLIRKAQLAYNLR